MDPLLYTAMAAWAAFAAGAAWCAASAAQGMLPADGGAPRDLAGVPLSFRILLPLAPALRGLSGSGFFARARERIDGDLAAAGLDGKIDSREAVALAFLCPVALGIPFCGLVALARAIVPDAVPRSVAIALCALVPPLLALSPRQWIKSAVKRRHLSITKALPFVLDLLTLSVEAGMDFMAALQRSCAVRKRDALNEELSRMSREILVGTPRRKALRNMAQRARHPDLKAVATALIQSDELGVSIGAILRIQAAQMRERRFERAEKLANEAPVKMLGPLMLCIFPAVFLILLGPVMAKAAHGLF